MRASKIEAEMPREGVPESPSKKVSLDRLLTYCVYVVNQSGSVCSVSRLVYECFTRFPERFCLPGYPHWPDSERVTKTWRRCRTDFGWIEGSNVLGFRVTSTGREVARQVERLLHGNSQAPVQSSASANNERRTYESLHLKRIREHPAFARFQRQGSAAEIPETDFRHLLMCTLESPERILRQNLRELQNIAKTENAGDILAFLAALEERFKRVLQRR